MKVYCRKPFSGVSVACPSLKIFFAILKMFLPQWQWSYGALQHVLWNAPDAGGGHAQAHVEEPGHWTPRLRPIISQSQQVLFLGGSQMSWWPKFFVSVLFNADNAKKQLESA